MRIPIKPFLTGLAMLCAASTAHAAKCVKDPDFADFPQGTPGYNDQTHKPYFYAAMNSRITDDNRIIVDSSLGETAPPLHWKYKSVKLSWPAYTGPDTLAGYGLVRQDYLYDDDANAAETLVTGTEAIRPNHASKDKLWIIYRLKEGGVPAHCSSPSQGWRYCVEWAKVQVKCGEDVGTTTNSATATFLETSIGPEAMPAELPYEAGRFSTNWMWNPWVDRILGARRNVIARREAAEREVAPTLSITDVRVDEAAGPAVFTVLLSKSSAETVTVDYTTVPDSALTPDDYTAVSGTLTFPPGTLTQTISVPVIDDTAVESEERFELHLTSKTHATHAGDGVATATITDDDTRALNLHTVFIYHDPSHSAAAVRRYETAIGLLDGANRPYTVRSGADRSAVDRLANVTNSIIPRFFAGDPEAPGWGPSRPRQNNGGLRWLRDTALGNLPDVPPAPLPALGIADATVDEDVGDASFTVTLSAASAETVTVDYTTVAGTATTGADYTAVSGTLSIGPGETTGIISVPIVDDDEDEASETFEVRLTSKTHATLGDGVGLGTITDNDDPPVQDLPTLSIADLTVAEDVGDADFTVILSAISKLTVTVDYTTSPGTATAGEDYTASSGTLSIAPGETIGTITVPIIADDEHEGSETFEVRLTSKTHATLADAVATGTISDDDLPTLSIADATAAEDAGTVDFTVTMSEASTDTVTVDYTTLDATATSPGDYTATSGTLSIAPGATTGTIAVPVVDDTHAEGPETFHVQLTSKTHATLAEGGGVATGTITDNDLPTLSIADATAAEDDASIDFTVTMSQISKVTVTVDYTTVDATATSPGDYTATSGTLTIGPGETTGTISVPIVADDEAEDTETFEVRLTSKTHATLGDGVATGTITEVGPPALQGEEEALPTLSIADATAAEGAGDVDFTVTLSAASAETVTVDYTTFDATATAPGDYTAVSGTLSIGPGETTGTITVPIVDDAVTERSETFEVRLTSKTHATLGDGDGVATGTITDDDLPGLSIAGGVFDEGAGSATFTVTLSAATEQTVTVGYATVDKLARAPDDYPATSGTVSFAPGVLTATFTVPIVDDEAGENLEMFAVCLSAPAHAVIGDDGIAFAVIRDNDGGVGGREGTLVSNIAGRTLVHSRRVFAQRFVTGSNPQGYVFKDLSTFVSAGAILTYGIRTDVDGRPGRMVYLVENLDPDTAYWLMLNERAARAGVHPRLRSSIRLVHAGASTSTEGWTITGTAYHDSGGGWTPYSYRGVSPQVAVGISGTVIAAPPPPATDRPSLSVADAEAAEGAEAGMAFAVTLDAAAAHDVTVHYSTADGTAHAGADYAAVAGALRFAAGETSKTVTVAILDDAHDDDGETFTLRLTGPSGAEIADGEATGTIRNSDPMPQAWIARFGRAVAEQVLDAVDARMAAPRTAGKTVTLGGHLVEAGGSAVPGHRPWPATGSGAASWLKSIDVPSDDRTGAWRDREIDPTALLMGSTFSLASGDERSGHYALWGRGAVSSFDGREDGVTVDGEVASAFFGADWTRDRATLGLMVGHSRGEGGYDATSGAGTVSSTLTGLYPWMRRDLGERLELWGVAGYGEGTLTLTPEDTPAMRTDLDLVMGAVGLRGTVVEAPETGGVELALTTDAMGVRTSTAEVRGLSASDAGVTRLRLGVEGTRAYRFEGGAAFTPRLEVGMRHDGGDAETGFGVDVGGGVAWSDPARGLSVDLSARGLLSHEADGFRDAGLSGALSWDARSGGGRGPRLTVAQTLGTQASGGVDALLERGTLAGVAASDDGAGPEADAELFARRRFEATFGYGFAVWGDRFTATPEVGVGLSEAGRDYRLGWWLAPAGRGATDLSFGIEAVRRESAGDSGSVSRTGGGDPEHRIGFTLQSRW